MIIKVKARPKAKMNKIKKLSNKEYIIHTTETPEKGKANKEIIRILAKEIRAAKSRIRIIKGEKMSNKIIEIDD